jgi:syntaxin-binding protein 1
MSLSDSSSHGAGGFRTFRQTSRDRLLQEMLHAARTGKGSAEWKVLIMDEVTVKVMSCTCKMADITDEGISCESSSLFFFFFCLSVCLS